MRTLLILTKQPLLAAAIQAVLDQSKYQIVAKEDIWEAESLLTRGAIDATILDVELTDVRAVRLIEELKNCAPGCPIIVYTGAKQNEWEEDAYMQGVSHVLAKPVRGKLLNMLLDRCFQDADKKAAAPESAPAPAPARQSKTVDHMRGLEALRNFSGILAFSLDSDSLLKEFLLLLREIIGVNRAVIFLRKPGEITGTQDDRWLRSTCAIGLEQTFLDHFALSLTGGIGAHLRRSGRILKSDSPETLSSREIQKEFQLLGAQVAIPILDRESLIGIAVFDERLTGEPYANEELTLIFHMLEEIGLAIRNSWLHDQLNTNHDMVADILSHLGSGCVVVSSALEILHANNAARKFFMPEKTGKNQLDFADLPQELGSRVFTVMKTGAPVPAFKYQLPSLSGAFFQVSILPFRAKAGDQSNPASAALLLIEDITELEKNQRLEVEASNLRLVKSMAEHLAHEIGNSLVPVSTHQQLLAEKYDDPEFRESFSEALASGVKRISRLANQMIFLARDKSDFVDKIRISELIVEALREAHLYHTGKIVTPNFKSGEEPWMVAGDYKALKHAFSEVMLNALQANPKDPNVSVRMTEGPAGDGGYTLLSVEVRDTGSGFTNETAGKAQEPFYSTRNIGLGLGLTVTRKIIENHHGKVEITPTQKGQPGVVRISLPLAHEI
ncbi:MAG TPA: ATP-binding protein [Chthoniobacteraceae bacterium]|nr:ATP-binding protein [Chthoniobacteraceae bacterium]